MNAIFSMNLLRLYTFTFNNAWFHPSDDMISIHLYYQFDKTFLKPAFASFNSRKKGIYTEYNIGM